MQPESYTLDEWLKGVPPPHRNTYVYGVGIGLKNKLVPYVIRGGHERPFHVLEVLEEHEADVSVEEANRLRNELREKYKAQREAGARKLEDLQRSTKAHRAAEEARRAEVGRVAAHSDGQGIHMAILLDPGPESFALFLTTRPTWARLYRPLTRDEGALVGLRSNQRPTFLAPVMRPRAEFSLTPRQFPESRVVELLAEFPRSYAS